MLLDYAAALGPLTIVLALQQFSNEDVLQTDLGPCHPLTHKLADQIGSAYLGSENGTADGNLLADHSEAASRDAGRVQWRIIHYLIIQGSIILPISAAKFRVGTQTGTLLIQRNRHDGRGSEGPVSSHHRTSPCHLDPARTPGQRPSDCAISANSSLKSCVQNPTEHQQPKYRLIGRRVWTPTNRDSATIRPFPAF